MAGDRYAAKKVCNIASYTIFTCTNCCTAERDRNRRVMEADLAQRREREDRWIAESQAPIEAMQREMAEMTLQGQQAAPGMCCCREMSSC